MLLVDLARLLDDENKALDGGGARVRLERGAHPVDERRRDDLGEIDLVEPRPQALEEERGALGRLRHQRRLFQHVIEHKPRVAADKLRGSGEQRLGVEQLGALGAELLGQHTQELEHERDHRGVGEAGNELVHRLRPLLDLHGEAGERDADLDADDGQQVGVALEKQQHAVLQCHAVRLRDLVQVELHFVAQCLRAEDAHRLARRSCAENLADGVPRIALPLELLQPRVELVPPRSVCLQPFDRCYQRG